ncbi:MAG: phage tail tape measure protein, partial [Desulfobulbaceae bacterium]|nr:phage tail tape measure protein [Desulfobulbaceae bacterium]
LVDKLKAIKATAFEVQAWTPFDMGQVVALEKELFKAGAKYKDVVGSSGAAAAASALGVYQKLDPQEMGKNMIGIASPFKIQGDQFMGLADQIARASAASTVGAADIAETAKYAAPGMASLNREVGEMLILSAMMAKRGLGGSMGGTGIRQFFLGAAKSKALRDSHGNLKSLAEIIATLKKNLDGLGEAEQLEALTKLFDMRGAPVAMALMEEGDAYGQVKADMEASIPLMAKIDILMQGHNRQLESLKGTARSTIADLFQPALKPIDAVIAKTNEFVAALGRASQENEAIGKGVSALSLSTVAVGAATTAVAGGAAIYYARKVLKGVGGMKGLFGGAASVAGGIATGKAIEASTGVSPVFVTNWPGGFMPGGGGVGTVAAEVAAGGLLAKSAGWLRGLAAKALGPIAMSGFGLSGAGLAVAGGGGYYGAKALGADALGAMLGNKLFDIFHATADRPVENKINLHVSIDERNRVAVTGGDGRSKTAVSTLRRGGL